MKVISPKIEHSVAYHSLNFKKNNHWQMYDVLNVRCYCFIFLGYVRRLISVKIS